MLLLHLCLRRQLPCQTLKFGDKQKMLYVNFLLFDYGRTDSLVTEFIASLIFLKLPFCLELLVGEHCRNIHTFELRASQMEK